MISSISESFHNYDDIVIIDGIKYLIDDLMNGATIDATECCFASIHKPTGKLLCIIYHGNGNGILTSLVDHPQGITIIWYEWMGVIPNYHKIHDQDQYIHVAGTINMCNYLLAIPGIERLYDGDLEVIANVKRVMELFYAEQQLFHDKMIEFSRNVVSCRTKACRN